MRYREPVATTWFLMRLRREVVLPDKGEISAEKLSSPQTIERLKNNIKLSKEVFEEFTRRILSVLLDENQTEDALKVLVGKDFEGRLQKGYEKIYKSEFVSICGYEWRVTRHKSVHHYIDVRTFNEMLLIEIGIGIDIDGYSEDVDKLLTLRELLQRIRDGFRKGKFPQIIHAGELYRAAAQEKPLETLEYILREAFDEDEPSVCETAKGHLALSAKSDSIETQAPTFWAVDDQKIDGDKIIELKNHFRMISYFSGKARYMRKLYDEKVSPEFKKSLEDLRYRLQAFEKDGSDIVKILKPTKEIKRLDEVLDGLGRYYIPLRSTFSKIHEYLDPINISIINLRQTLTKLDLRWEECDCLKRLFDSVTALSWQLEYDIKSASPDIEFSEELFTLISTEIQIERQKLEIEEQKREQRFARIIETVGILLGALGIGEIFSGSTAKAFLTLFYKGFPNLSSPAQEIYAFGLRIAFAGVLGLGIYLWINRSLFDREKKENSTNKSRRRRRPRRPRRS